MRIAMMTNNYKPVVGGVPISIERLAQGLRKKGHVVYIFAPYVKGCQEEEFVIRYKAFQKKAGGYVPLMKPVDREMEEKFRNLSFDIIHVHHPVLIGQRAQYLGKKYHIPVVFTYHTRYEEYLHYWKPYRWLKERNGKIEEKAVDFIENQMVLSLIRRFTEKCSLVIAPTAQIEHILEQRGWQADITVMPTGLPEETYRNSGRWQEIRRTYGKGKTHLLCTVSRLSAEKNQGFLLKSLLLLKEKIGTDFQMLIIGDGPEKQKLTETAEKLGLEEQVTFTGTVSNEEIPDFYQACDAFLFASKSETQGLVLLEAMAGGNPVIAVEATGVCDIVKNGENGYMTAEDEEVFAEKTAEVLNDNTLRQQLKEGAKETAMRYRNDVVAGMAEHHYGQILLSQSWKRESYMKVS